MVQRSKFRVPFAVLVLGSVLGSLAIAPNNRAAGEWRVYGADLANTKYSPLDQITRDNVGTLRVAWRWQSIDQDVLGSRSDLHTFLNEGTPVMAGGRLYTVTSLSQVAAIDPATGRTIWSYDPKSYEAGQPVNLGFVNRGLAYWRDGEVERLFFGTGDGHLIALDARSGRPVRSFGIGGRIDLTQGLRRPVERATYSVTSPPIVARGVVVVGSSGPRSSDATDRRAWRRSRLRRAHGTVALDLPYDPRARRSRQRDMGRRLRRAYGQHERVDDHERRRNARVRLPAREHAHVGLLRRPAARRESLRRQPRRIDAESGRRVWHFQTTHHGVWDYDPPAAPVLADVAVGGRMRKAVAQVTKQGFCFVFDRVTGRADLANRRAAGAGVDARRRAHVADAAVSDPSGPVRSTGDHRKRPDRLHAGAP